MLNASHVWPSGSRAGDPHLRRFGVAALGDDQARVVFSGAVIDEDGGAEQVVDLDQLVVEHTALVLPPHIGALLHLPLEHAVGNQLHLLANLLWLDSCREPPAATSRTHGAVRRRDLLRQ